MKYFLVEDLTSYSELPSTFELTRQEVVDLGTGGIGLPVLLLDLLFAGWPPPPGPFILAKAEHLKRTSPRVLPRSRASSWPTTGASRGRRLQILLEQVLERQPDR
jgi:hypothetical protein